MIRLRRFLATAGCFILAAPFAFAETDWDAANKAYHAGKYDEAKFDYLRLVQAGQYSPDLFYNLGNAWFKLGDQGRAILNYERALVLNPRLDEAQANRLSTLKVVGNDDEPTVRDRAGGYADCFVLTASIAFWIFAFALVFSFVKPRPVARLCRIISVLAGLAWVAGAGAAIWVGEGPKDPSRALVVDSMAELKYGPAVSARSAESLQIGNHVEILSERGDWTFCRASSGTLGWILTRKIERVIP
ncbi:MAG TPA: tetratricopeptide repeat protein [Chthoniobacterales bacterium]|nr:tetratricopeptide repeat protein [Chthoniobacterales bacterium]